MNQLRLQARIVEIGALLAVVRHENIQGTGGEEKVVYQVLNLLLAEIPQIRGKGDVGLLGKRKFPAGMHFHAERGLFALIRHRIRRIKQFAEQRGFACARLADKQDSCLI